MNLIYYYNETLEIFHFKKKINLAKIENNILPSI